MAENDVLSLPALSNALSLTTSSTAWTLTSWQVVGTPSTTNTVYLIGVVVQHPTVTITSDVTYSAVVEIGTGATGSEVVKVQVPWAYRHDSKAEHVYPPATSNGPFFFSELVEIPANTQLSWRVAHSAAFAVAFDGLKVFYRVGAAGAQSVTPTGIASEEAFGGVTIAPGGVSISPSGITSEEAFGSVSITSLVTVSPVGISSEEAFGSPIVEVGAASISPVGIASEEAFGVPTVLPGVISVSPSGIASEEVFGSPAVSPGVVTVNMIGIASQESFGAVTIVGGESPGQFASNTLSDNNYAPQHMIGVR